MRSTAQRTRLFAKRTFDVTWLDSRHLPSGPPQFLIELKFVTYGYYGFHIPTIHDGALPGANDAQVVITSMTEERKDYTSARAVVKIPTVFLTVARPG